MTRHPHGELSCLVKKDIYLLNTPELSCDSEISIKYGTSTLQTCDFVSVPILMHTS